MLNVKFRQMRAVKWDGTDAVLQEIKALLLECHISEVVGVEEHNPEFSGGPGVIRFWLTHSRDYSHIIPRGWYLVVPTALNAQPIICKEFDFHGQFETT